MASTWSIWCFRRAVWANRYTVEHALCGNRLISSFGIFRICSRVLEDPNPFGCKKKLSKKKSTCPLPGALKRPSCKITAIKIWRFSSFSVGWRKSLGVVATWLLLHLLAFDQQSTALNFWSDWRMLWPAKTLTYASVNAMLEYLKWHVTTRIVILDYFTLILVKVTLFYTNTSKNFITRHNMAEHLVLLEGRLSKSLHRWTCTKRQSTYLELANISNLLRGFGRPQRASLQKKNDEKAITVILQTGF